jgi:protein-S-isoprenylcysteine O-methyltransferase Ste14
MRWASVFAGTAAYIGLSIWGEGGIGPYVAQPALVALTIVFFIVAIVAVFAGGDLSPGIREDRANRWVLIPFAVIGLALGYLPAYTDRIGWLTIDGNTTRWIGVVLAAVGSALRIWPVFVLGNRFSGLVAIQPNHRLQTTGIYSVIRHPSYAGLLILTAGWSLAFRSGVGLILIAMFVPPLLARIRSEEALLQSQFGAEYDAYRARTSRLIPGLF